MPSYIVERPVPEPRGAGAEGLVGVATRIATRGREAGPGVRWSKTLVTSDAIYCLYEARSRAALAAHLEQAGLSVGEPAELLLELVPTRNVRQREREPASAAAPA